MGYFRLKHKTMNKYIITALLLMLSFCGYSQPATLTHDQAARVTTIEMLDSRVAKEVAVLEDRVAIFATDGWLERIVLFNQGCPEIPASKDNEKLLRIIKSQEGKLRWATGQVVCTKEHVEGGEDVERRKDAFMAGMFLGVLAGGILTLLGLVFFKIKN